MPTSLTEFENVRQIPGEAKRRWFHSEDYELIVWYGKDTRAPTGFQLCYPRNNSSYSIIWKAPQRFIHERIDNGEESPFRNDTPVSVPDGSFEPEPLLRQFKHIAESIDPAVRKVVVDKLGEFPSGALEGSFSLPRLRSPNLIGRVGRKMNTRAARFRPKQHLLP